MATFHSSTFELVVAFHAQGLTGVVTPANEDEGDENEDVTREGGGGLSTHWGMSRAESQMPPSDKFVSEPP